VGIPLGVDSVEDDDNDGPKAQLNLVLGISHSPTHRQQHRRGFLWTALIPKSYFYENYRSSLGSVSSDLRELL
jgi:hypothetical protein